MNPTDKSQVNWIRRNETPEQRIARLEAKLRERGGKDPALEERIKQLKDRLGSGALKPGEKFENQPGRNNNQPTTPGVQPFPRVQLDDDPTTWTPEMQAELAPPRGMDTIFYDNPNSSDKVKLGREIDALNEDAKKGDGTPQGEEMKRIRQSETTQERITRLQAKLKGASPQKKKNLKARIEKLKQRRDSGESKPYEEKQKSKPIPTAETNETRRNESTQERITRLQEKLKGAGAEQKKQLKERIAKLKTRRDEGETKPNVTKPPTSPQQTANKQAPAPTAAKDKPKPTSQVSQDKAKTNETRRNEDLVERLSRLKQKLKTANPNAKAGLEERIKELEARIRAGDVKGSSVKNQPGTEDRPYRNRGVTNRPLSYGGKLRI